MVISRFVVSFFSQSVNRVAEDLSENSRCCSFSQALTVKADDIGLGGFCHSGSMGIFPVVGGCEYFIDTD